MKDIIEIALKAGVEASLAIMDIYQGDFGVYQKDDHSPVTDADLESTRIIEDRLSVFGFPIISEEKEIPSFQERKKFDKYFLIDPLDGTKEFVHKTGEFCVNIALVENNVPVLGYIFDPYSNRVVFGGNYTNQILHCDFNENGKVLERNIIQDTSVNELAENSVKLVCSRRADIERLKESARDLFNVDKIEIKTKGSALKFIDLALNKADVYLRYGKTMEWDIAPGFAILKYMNGTIGNLDDGNDLLFNKENLLNPPFMAYKKKLNE